MAAGKHIVINITNQTLTCLDQQSVVKEFAISSARRGTGQKKGSFQTPLGQHIIRAKIGSGQPTGSVFVGRRPTGEIWCEKLGLRYPERDWILTRILWLSGRQRGHNRLGRVDSMRRFIYIHGTPDCGSLGKPVSQGCIRMANIDVIWLFDWVDFGTPVSITAGDADSDTHAEYPSSHSRRDKERL